MNLSINNDHHMFELKYRPATLDECILPASDKAILQAIVKTGLIPHLILHSDEPGTGKTTTALALCNDVNARVLFVNGSDCKIDFVRGPLTQFASAMSTDGRPRVIVIDEFDRHGLAEAQLHMRTFMEAYGDNCSIIITANNLEGIVAPLRSRARVIKFGIPTEQDAKSMMVQMVHRAKAICDNEGIEVKEPRVLAALVKQNFPDFRKVTNLLDFYSSNKVIDTGILSVVLEQRDLSDLVAVIKNKEISKIFPMVDKYVSSYSSTIESLMDILYPLVTDQSKPQLIEIMGENNQFFGLAGSHKVHMRMLIARLALTMQWI